MLMFEVGIHVAGLMMVLGTGMIIDYWIKVKSTRPK